MAFSPSPGQLLSIDGASYRFMARRDSAQDVFVRRGRRSTVYRLAGGDGALYALKVFAGDGREVGAQAAERAPLLGPYAQIAGLQVCNRTVLTPQQHGDLIRHSQELAHAILMPWIGDMTWQDMVKERLPLPPELSHAWALSLARTLAAMEEQQVTHGALAGEHIVVLHDPPAVGLVSVEGLIAPRLPDLALPARASDGYTHKAAPADSRQPWLDRFAGSIVLAEMLGWCDPRVVQVAAGMSYFAPGEPQEPVPRYRTLSSALGACWGGDVVRMFASAWHSPTPEDCPGSAEWIRILDGLPLPRHIAVPGLDMPAPSPADPGGISAREERARNKIEAGARWLDGGQQDRAIEELQEAYRVHASLAAPHLARALQQRARASEQRGDVVAALSDYEAARLVAPSRDLQEEISRAIDDLSARQAAGEAPPLVPADPPLEHDPAISQDPAVPPAREGDTGGESTPNRKEKASPVLWGRSGCAVVIVALGLILMLGSLLLVFRPQPVDPTLTSTALSMVTPATTVIPSITPVTVTSAVPVTPSVALLPSPTLLPDTSPTARTPAATPTTGVTVTPVTPTALPEDTITITAVEPLELLSAVLPTTITLRGKNLTRIEQVALVAEGQPGIPFIPRDLRDDQGAFLVDQPAANISGTITYTLEIDGQAFPIRIPLIATRKMQGVLDGYRYTTRIGTDEKGAYTQMRMQPDTSSGRVGLLRNGDQVEVLDEVQGADDQQWYQVRIRASADSAQIGVVGWVERWLVENEDVPPSPTPIPAPRPTSTPAQPARLRFRVLNYNDNPTCITVQIRGINTAGWKFSVDGLTHISGTFDGGGNARACGLGPGQEVTITVLNSRGSKVSGGVGVPSKGSAIMVADWK